MNPMFGVAYTIEVVGSLPVSITLETPTQTVPTCTITETLMYQDNLGAWVTTLPIFATRANAYRLDIQSDDKSLHSSVATFKWTAQDL